MTVCLTRLYLLQDKYILNNFCLMLFLTGWVHFFSLLIGLPKTKTIHTFSLFCINYNYMLLIYYTATCLIPVICLREITT